MKFWNQRVLPISLLAGTIIGAGVFSLPYVFSVAGIFVSVLFAILFSCLSICIYFMYSDLLRLHPGERYMGLMHTYFGERGYRFSFLLDIFQSFLALTIYLVLSVSFLQLIIPDFPHLWYVCLFWIVGSFLIFAKNKNEAVSEFVATAGIAIIIILLFVVGSKNFFSGGNFIFSTSPMYVLLPFASLLFAFNGRSAIPDLIAVTSGKVSVLRKAIIGGVVVPLILYILFVAGIIGLSAEVSTDAVSGLIGRVSPFLLCAVGALGILALISSYLAIGENVRKTFVSDMKLSTFFAGGLVVAVPMLLYVAGFQNFLALIAVTGGILTATEWICTACMWKKSVHILHSDKNSSIHLLLPTYKSILFYMLVTVLFISIFYTIFLFLN